MLALARRTFLVALSLQCLSYPALAQQIEHSDEILESVLYKFGRHVFVDDALMGARPDTSEQWHAPVPLLAFEGEEQSGSQTTTGSGSSSDEEDRPGCTCSSDNTP